MILATCRYRKKLDLTCSAGFLVSVCFLGLLDPAIQDRTSMNFLGMGLTRAPQSLLLSPVEINVN